MSKIFGMRKILACVLTLLLALAVPAPAFAAELSAAADVTSVNTGDIVTLTVVVSDKHLAVAQGTFTYDPKLLKYTGSNGGASDGYINLVSAQNGGASSLTAVIKFKAAAAGDAKISVSMESALDYDGKKLGKPNDAEVLVKVTASAAASDKGEEPDKGETKTPAPDVSQTGVAAKNVKGAAAQMYIWRSLESLTLPSGFYDRQVEYGGENVGGAAIPDNDDFILLYLSEKKGENAGYYIFDKEKDALYPYVIITSVQANFTFLWPDNSITAPEGFEQATLKWKGQELPAWTAKGSDGTVYLVYARNAAGDTGFFLYNSKDKSVLRYETFARTESGSADKPALNPDIGQGSDGITIDHTVFFLICLGGLALLAAVVILIILYIHKNPHKKHQPSPADP